MVRNQHKLVSDRGPSVEADRLASESEMRQIQEKIEALVDRIASLPKEVDAGVLIQKVTELQARKGQLADYIVRLSSELAGMSREKQNPEEVRKAIRMVNTRLNELSAPLKREIIRQLITQIDFGRKVMKVTLNPLGLIVENPVLARDYQGKKNRQ